MLKVYSSLHSLALSLLSRNDPIIFTLAMSQDRTQVCSVCGVKIIKLVGDDRVIFSTGAASTRLTLWERVCRHTQKPGCINQNYSTTEQI